MWKLLCESVRGVSHETSELPCQDHSLGEWVKAGEETVLLLACADGAGSAEHAEIGARIACQSMLHEIQEAFSAGIRLSDVDAVMMTSWHRRARELLSAEADLRSTRPREFACTLLTAIVGEQEALFSQIGDGAIVLSEDNSYGAVFWPQSGEYLNTTNFLTDDEFESRLEFRRDQKRVDELALLTDGLQMLALRYADKSVHGPFFQSMFAALRGADDASTLQTPLHDFLTSSSVNRRTDDDKTLILATRRLPNGAAQLVRQPEPPS
jgi:serine/threonine protein phosphatase PrpC